MKFQRKKLFRRILLFLLLFVLFSIPLICAYIVYDPLKLSPTTFTKSFANALTNRDIKKAHSLSSPNLWDEIDYWINNSGDGPTRCSVIDKFEERYFAVITCSGDRESTQVWCDYAELCGPINYRFRLDHVVLKREGKSWQAIEYEYICESWDGKCLE
jgi:hypothetical protein